MVRLLHNHGPLTLIEPDPWPTEPLIVASVSDSESRELFTRSEDGTAYESLSSYIENDAGVPLANVVPVTVVPVAALPVLWSALERWLNHANRILPSEETQLLVGAVVALRGQTEALGLDHI